MLMVKPSELLAPIEVHPDLAAAGLWRTSKSRR